MASLVAFVKLGLLDVVWLKQAVNPGASYYYPQQTMTMTRRRVVAAEVADPSASDGSKPPRRASSLELILSPMVESTLQRRLVTALYFFSGMILPIFHDAPAFLP